MEGLYKYGLRPKGIPTDKYELLSAFYGLAGTVQFTKDKKNTLQDLLKSGKAIIGYVEKVQNDRVYIKKKLPSGIKSFSYKIDMDDFNSKLSVLKVKDLNSICIFALQDSYNIFNFAIFNVSERGLYSESGFEIAYYDYLSEQNQLFWKPSSPNIKYYGASCDYIPDAIIKKQEKEIIVEIFGINTKEYREKMEKKINLLKRLKNDYIAWYPNNGEKMPTLDKF